VATSEITSFLTVAGAIVAGLWAIYTYREKRERELSQQRTGFIFENARILDSDPGLQEALSILNDMHFTYDVDDFIRITNKKTVWTEEEIRIVTLVDNLLNYLWRIAYAHITLKTLTLNDLNAFGYYYWRIIEHEGLITYSKEEGYGEIVTAAKRLRKIWAREEAG
jgi:hypothetical protein